MSELAGRRVIITGATGGLGGHVVQRWVRGGASVVGVASRPESAARAQAEHPEVPFIVSDLTSDVGAAEMLAQATNLIGPPDTLLHLAGSFEMGEIDAEGGDALWQRVFAANLDSAFHAFRAITPGLKARGGGWLLVVGSKAVETHPAKMTAYVASKAALLAFARSLSEELKPFGIHVNAVLPSTIDSPGNRAAMGEKHADRWVDPATIADATVFVCTNSALFGASLETYGLS